MVFFGLIFMLIPSFMMLGVIKGKNKTSTLKKPKTTTSTQPIPTTTTEEEKYKNINDSIIK